MDDNRTGEQKTTDQAEQVKRPVPPAIQRLLDEVRLKDNDGKPVWPNLFDRAHNRHNR